MTSHALLIIDLQNDFMPGGALEVPSGDETVAVANEWMSRTDFVVATQDWHPHGHMSFASSHAGASVGDVVPLDGVDQFLWPDHCVQGTPGASFHSGLDVARIDQVVRKGTNPRVDSYSGFYDNAKRANTGLGSELRSRGIEKLTVLGLALDYCVKFTVLDALELGFDVDLVRSGCRAVNVAPGDGDRALEEISARGGEVID